MLHVRFYAIDTSMNINNISREFDLSRVADRVLTVVTALNMARCMQHFVSQLPTAMALSLYATTKRRYSEVSTIGR
jgi:hypothetical protein